MHLLAPSGGIVYTLDVALKFVTSEVPGHV